MDLTLRHRQPVEDEIENWDDEDLDIGGDDFAFQSRATSMATTATGHHRDSVSSRLSIRSDFDSNHGDEDRQVHIPGDDEKSTKDAIAAATRVGIPIPQNVPTSALMGGTIKRLGGRKIKQIIQQDDWDDDLELPNPDEGGLKIKSPDASIFPDALRQISGLSAQPSPAKGLQPSPVFGISPRPSLMPKMPSPNINLDRFKDDDDDDDLFGHGGATIKVAKRTGPKPMTLIMPPTPAKQTKPEDDDFETDLQLPSDGQPLRLSARKDIPKTPVSAQDEFDEWGEGSLGTRFGGTKRDGRSNRSSSVSALSPSVASSLTIESEDEGLDGLVLPSGPLNFDDILKKRQQTQSPEHDSKQQAARRASVKDDFLAGLEIGDGDVFDSSKLTLNRNIKVKTIRPTSPQRPKTAASLTFTSKPSPPVSSRLPRPLVHDRLPSTLAPVSESGGPITNRAPARRSQSRIGHSAQSSITSIPTPTTPSSTHSMPPSTPRRRDLAQKPSISALRTEATTTNSQLLKVKRSMPTMRPPQSPAKPMLPRYEGSSRMEGGGRPSLSRPKTPIERDRSGAESSMSLARRNPLPFLPAGASQAQSHHVNIKSSRHFRRNDSESSNEFRPQSRAISRSTMRSPSPSRSRLIGTEALAREAAVKRQVTKPVRRRHFGDGFELDGFDDLPTSHNVEQKFMKQPISRPATKSLLRNKISQNNLSDGTMTPVPLTPYSPTRYNDSLPRFARDTNASRMAREQVLSQRAPSNGAPLTALTNQWKAQIAAKTGLSAVNPPSRTKKSKPAVQQKPHLIKPLGDVSRNTKSIKGMIYNPVTFRWEGNENDLSPFDHPSASPSIASVPPYFREKETSTPRPALITNINASQGVQVVGGMVFDPQKMCWLKMPVMRPPTRSGRSEASAGDTMDGFDAFDDDEEDVFKDVPDLEDKPSSPSKEDGGERKTGGDGGSLKDDWLVGEEFDVGPEFVRRQREEEERWRRKCEKWVGKYRDAVETEEWRWRIRDVVNEL